MFREQQLFPNCLFSIALPSISTMAFPHYLIRINFVYIHFLPKS